MSFPSPARLRRALLAATACCALTACASPRDPGTTGSIGREEPASVAQAAALRASGKSAEAIVLLRAALARDPKSKTLALAYGRALAEAGQGEQALGVLAQAQDAKHPDWRMINTEGAVLDQLGRTMDAQQRYQLALKLAPDEPTILSNLGLSLALTQKPAEAEAVLRRAVAQPSAGPKIRQNLALVLALQGKYAEAEELARRDLSPEEAAANVSYWKQSLKAPAKAAPAAKRAPAPLPTDDYSLKG